MFIIIGGDGKEYGPVTADQVRTWINAGRANLDTKAKAFDSEEWRRLGDFAEFSPPSGAPPVIRGESVNALPGTLTAAGGLVQADRGTRLLARVIDWAIEFVVAIPGGMILGSEFIKLAMTAMQGEEPDFSQLDYQRLWLGGLVFAATWLVLFVVQVWMLTTRGQTIGKRLTSIRIVRVEDESNPGIVHAWVLRQCLFTIFGVITSLIPILGIVFRPTFHLVDWCMIFRDDQRCLHDLVAKTKVVRV